MKLFSRLALFLLLLLPLWVKTPALTLTASADLPSCTAGTEVRVTFTADDCTENGVAGFTLDLTYDPAVFAFLSAEPLGEISDGEFSYSYVQPEGRAVLLYVDDLAGGSPLRGKAVALCAITLQAKTTAYAGSSAINCVESQFAAHNGVEIIDLPSTGGKITLAVKRPASASGTADARGKAASGAGEFAPPEPSELPPNFPATENGEAGALEEAAALPEKTVNDTPDEIPATAPATNFFRRALTPEGQRLLPLLAAVLILGVLTLGVLLHGKNRG